jgi:YggT family protein
MQNALTFVFRTLLDLYIITFALRLIMQWIRADGRNPLSQFIIRVTNPLVIPARRFVPSFGSLDTATLLILVGLELLATGVLIKLACIGAPDIGQYLTLTLLRLIHLALRVYLFIILFYVILSWISPGVYNPASALLSAMAEPVLTPLRKLIPSIGGLDLSPLFALIIIQAITMLLPVTRATSGLICSSVGQLL